MIQPPTPTPIQSLVEEDSLEERIYSLLRSRHADFALAELSESGSVSVEVLNRLVKSGRATLLPNERYLSDVAATRLQETARRLVGAYHKKYPLVRAMPRESLAEPLQKAAAFKDFASVLSWLVSEGVLISEGTAGVRLPDHSVQVPVAWQEAAHEIREVYVAAGLQPPLPGNFQANYPRDINVPGILAILVELGDLIPLGERLYVSVQAIEETKAVLRRLAALPEGITVGGVRNATGASRRVLLPLLEYFDDQGFTRRSGESRVLA
jgi:selenocysteine-specific elongation factor